MRQLPPHLLWLGHAGDLRAPRELFASGIQAIVDLALEEKPATLPRELVYLRFPLLDCPDNPRWVLRAAVDAVASLLQAQVPTLVCCGAGLSRSPAIAAAALTRVGHGTPGQALARISELGACDVSPGLWQDIQNIMDE